MLFEHRAVRTIIEQIYRLLKHLGNPQDVNKTIIFTATKRMADECTLFLREQGYNALAIHGDKRQNERDWVMSQFKTGRCPIMIATDVAARGLGKDENSISFAGDDRSSSETAYYVARTHGVCL